MPDLDSAPQITTGAADDFLSRRNSDGELVRVPPGNIPTGAPFGGAGIADEVLLEENYQFTSKTYDGDQVLVSGTVKWPDGSTGVYTTVEIDATHLLINAYTVTHATSGKTVTQPTVTRDADGNPTAIPEKTVA